MDALEKNATWDLVELPRKKTLVGYRWVFTLKYKEMDHSKVTRQD